MLETICYPCELGQHDNHHEIIEMPPPGVLGGACCRCKGECVDGRYVPAQFKNIKRFVEERFGTMIPNNIILGEE